MRTARWRAGSCWSAATNARRTDSRAPTILGRIPVRDDEPVRHRLDPELVRGAQVLDDRRTGGAQIHRPRTPLAALEHVEANVRRDAVEPRAKRGAALKAVEALPRTDERLLDRVFGLDGAEHAVAVRGQLDAVLLELKLDRRSCGEGRVLHGDHRRRRRAPRGRPGLSPRVISESGIIPSLSSDSEEVPDFHNNEGAIPSSHSRRCPRRVAGRVRLPPAITSRKCHRSVRARGGSRVRHDSLGTGAPGDRRGVCAYGTRVRRPSELPPRGGRGARECLGAPVRRTRLRTVSDSHGNGIRTARGCRNGRRRRGCSERDSFLGSSPSS